MTIGPARRRRPRASRYATRHVDETFRAAGPLDAIEYSVASRVLELTTVPVVMIAGDKPSGAERYGMPVGLGAALALLLYAAAD